MYIFVDQCFNQVLGKFLINILTYKLPVKNKYKTK